MIRRVLARIVEHLRRRRDHVGNTLPALAEYATVRYEGQSVKGVRASCVSTNVGDTAVTIVSHEEGDFIGVSLGLDGRLAVLRFGTSRDEGLQEVIAWIDDVRARVLAEVTRKAASETLS